METSSEAPSASSPNSTPQKPISLWQRAKAISLKKMFVICLGIGAGLTLAVVGVGASIVWFTSQPIPAREWPGLDVQSAGLQAKLKTDWNDSVRYQLVVTPRADDLKAAFDSVVRTHRESISFTIHLFDSAGFELCKKDVKPTPFVDASDHYEGLHANESFYSFECPRSQYKRAKRWSLSYVFPPLVASGPADWHKLQGPDGKWYKTQAASEQDAKAKVANFIGSPATGDDTLTGFDYVSGHLETRSGKTFLIYREGERNTANLWDTSAKLHFECKVKSDCLIENTDNNEGVHGKLLR